MNVPEELIPRLKKLWNAGLSAAECGAELGLVGTPDEVRAAVIAAHQVPTKAQRKSSTNPDAFWTDERLAVLRKMRADGDSAAQIADELGCSRSAVLGKCNRLGLSNPAPARLPRLPAGPRPQRTGKFRSNLPARYSAGESDEDAMFKSDGADGAPAPKDLEIPVERRRSLLGPPHSPYPERKERECGWPVGDPKVPGFFFCGDPTDGDHYCAHHARRAGAGYYQRKAA